MVDRWVGALPQGLLCFVAAIVVFGLVTGCGGGSTSEGTPPPSSPPSNPTPPAAAAPGVSSVSPATVAVGAAAFTLQINGSGFVSGSVVSWNGTNLTTTYVSATELQAAVPASLAAGAGSFAIAVSNPDGQKSASSSSSVAVDNPAPTITGLAPKFVNSGSPALNVTVTGTGFVAGSVASFGGSARTTTVQSSTQLTMALTADDLAYGAIVDVMVANPAPGGGTSAASALTIEQQAPTITGVTPDTLVIGVANTPVTIAGSGFTPNAVVSASGLPLNPTSITPTSIAVSIPAAVAGSYAGLIDVSVQTVAGLAIFSLNVVNPVPVIQSVSPSIVLAGSPGMSVTVQATGLTSTTQANVNGAAAGPLSTAAGGVAVPISAAQFAQTGTVSITLTNPAPGGGTSNVAQVKVIPGSNYVRTVNLPANDLVWNSQQQVIYGSIAASSTTNPSSVVAIDPTTGNVVAAQTMPSEPSVLAISDDQQYLYVGMNGVGSVARLKLPGLTPDIQWTVGPSSSNTSLYPISDIEVAPGAPHTIAVTAEVASTGGMQLAVYDDNVMRPNTSNASLLGFIGYVNTVRWGADASTIYGTESAVSGGPEFIFAVNAEGVTLSQTYLGAIAGFQGQLAYDSNEGRLYDSVGDVVNAATGQAAGTFPAAGSTFALDSTQHRVYFLGGTPYPEGESGSGTEINVFDQDKFTHVGSIVLPSTSTGSGPGGVDPRMVRWGTTGLAFNSPSNIYILDGPFVAAGASPAAATGGYASPTPVLSSVSPESVVAGSPDVTLTLTGANFTAATLVRWNGNYLATSVVSDTEVQAVIPAAALATPTSAPLLVDNSGDGLSGLLAFSVLPDLGTGLQLTTLNLSGNDLVWNAAANRLYVAVTNTDTIRPQTIASVDPVAGAVVSSEPVAANPYVMAISADDKYLYTGFTNNASVQRYTLPDLTADLLIPLGIGDPVTTVAGDDVRGGVGSCDFAVSLGVAPAANTTIAVTQGSAGTDPEGCGAVAVIDGATPRPTTPAIYTESGHDFSKLTWGADGTALYAFGDDGVTSQPVSKLTVSSSGVVFDQEVTNNIYLGYRPHFDIPTGLLYGDGGAIIQPSTLASVSNFQASGLMVPDSTLGFAYFLGQTQSQVGGNYGQGNANFTLQIFDLKTYALLDSIVIPNVIGYPIQLVRWGTSGIAFTTENGNFEDTNAPGLTYILSGSRISRTGGSLQPAPVDSERVQYTWKDLRPKRKPLSVTEER